jgi:RHS repeat-associated protein
LQVTFLASFNVPLTIKGKFVNWQRSEQTHEAPGNAREAQRFRPLRGFSREDGWLLSSSAPLFAMQLYYNTFINKQYNGNIAYQYWGTPGNLTNNYSYTYDKLNRLTGGVTGLDNYKETGITYDPMGNIATLNRYQAGTLIDQLAYTYTVSSNPTNQVQSINDGSGNDAGLLHGGWSYGYDPNGNLNSSSYAVDPTKNKSTTYNLLNLPLVATVPTGTVTYTYDATGNKLRKVDVLSGVTKTTDYISGIEYDNSTTAIGFIQNEEGKAVPNGAGFDYVYYLGDNLGNTRVTFGTKTGVAVVYQADDYYPFGLEINRSTTSPKNEYLLQRKELQEETQSYDFGARGYDPLIGRWTTIDPLAEKSRRWSPYNYVMDNPIRFIDPDGLETEEEINSDENRWASEKAGFNAGKNQNTSPASGFEANGQHAEEASKTNSGTAAGVAASAGAAGAAVGAAANSATGSGDETAHDVNAEPDANQGGRPDADGLSYIPRSY